MVCPGVVLTIANVGVGGAGFTFTVEVIVQPKGSTAVIETNKGELVGSEQVPTVVAVFKVNGVGAHVKLDGFAAEPEGVTVTTAEVPPQLACATEAKSNGAGVMVVLIILAIGAQDPGGCIYKV